MESFFDHINKTRMGMAGFASKMTKQELFLLSFEIYDFFSEMVIHTNYN